MCVALGGRTGQPSSKREAVTLLPSMNLSSLLLTSSSHPSRCLNTYLTGDVVILFPWMNLSFFASFVLYWTCYPSLMVACLLLSHNDEPFFLLFLWAVLQCSFFVLILSSFFLDDHFCLVPFYEGNLRERSLSQRM
jgi:hypothetical protein